MTFQPPPPTLSDSRPAGRAEPCWYCKTFIHLGDPIYPIAYGRYGCETCGHDLELQQRLTFRPPTRGAPGYAVKCPTCDVEPGELCLTVNDKKRPLHPGRKAIA